MKIKEITIRPHFWFERTYYLNHTVLSKSQRGYFGRMLKAKGTLGRVGKTGSFLIEELLGLKTISEVYITPDFIKIWIKRGHDWENIDSAILDILKNASDIERVR